MSWRLVSGVVLLVIQFVTSIVAWRIYFRGETHRASLLAAVALSIMLARRMTAVLQLLGLSAAPLVADVDRLVLPLLISVLWLVNRWLVWRS